MYGIHLRKTVTNGQGKRSSGIIRAGKVKLPSGESIIGIKV
jgi:hypothetical protein